LNQKARERNRSGSMTCDMDINEALKKQSWNLTRTLVKSVNCVWRNKNEKGRDAERTRSEIEARTKHGRKRVKTKKELIKRVQGSNRMYAKNIVNRKGQLY